MLVTPLLIVLLLFAVAAGRLVQARLDVDSAAQQAARAASLARDPRSRRAQADARSRRQPWPAQHVTCDPPPSARTPARSGPGGQVTVQVTCTVCLADLRAAARPRLPDPHRPVHLAHRRLPR